MQKLVEFYHNKGFDMLKLGISLPYLAKKCLHSPRKAKIYPLKEGDKDLPSKVRENLVGGRSKVFTGKAAVEELGIRNSKFFGKSFAGIAACWNWALRKIRVLSSFAQTQASLGQI